MSAVAGGSCAGAALLAAAAFLELRRRRRRRQLSAAAPTAPVKPRRSLPGTSTSSTGTGSAIATLATLDAPLLGSSSTTTGAAGDPNDALRTLEHGGTAWYDDASLTSTTETADAFSAATVAAATGGFADSRKLDEGAFGAVYRGTLPRGAGSGSGRHGGREVAIKVLKLDMMQAAAAADDDGEPEHKYSGEATFRREAELLGRVRHPNIVALLGHCVGAGVERPCLVCEFMEGASLKDRLDAAPSPSAAALTWRERHTIASDVARGLAFLHTEADPIIIHQDVKPANILLGTAPGGEGGIVAKLADFGISRVVPELAATQAKSYVKTQHAAGTPIYMPMELHRSGRVSVKVDAYAFGIVLLELLTGKPPRDEVTKEPLADAVDRQLRDPKRHMRDLVDPRAGDWNAKAWRALAVVARRCSEEKVLDRCKIADVVDEIDALAGRGGGRRRGWLGSWS